MRPGAVLPALAVAAMVGCGDDGGPTPPDLPVPPGSLVILSGDAQTIPAGGTFPIAVVVEARDSAGVPLHDVPIWFGEALATGQFPDEPRDTTGPDGTVTFTWQPGGEAGVHRLRAGVYLEDAAHVPHLVVADTISGTVTPGPPDRADLSGPTKLFLGEPLDLASLVGQVRDRYGNPVTLTSVGATAPPPFVMIGLTVHSDVEVDTVVTLGLDGVGFDYRLLVRRDLRELAGATGGWVCDKEPGAPTSTPNLYIRRREAQVTVDSVQLSENEETYTFFYTETWHDDLSDGSESDGGEAIVRLVTSQSPGEWFWDFGPSMIQTGSAPLRYEATEPRECLSWDAQAGGTPSPHAAASLQVKGATVPPAHLVLTAAALAACLSACGDGSSGPSPDAVHSLAIGPYPRVVLPSTTELRVEVAVFDSLDDPLPSPARSAFDWNSSDSSVVTVSREGIVRVSGSAAQGARAVIHVAYGGGEGFLEVFAALPPIGAKVVPEWTVTPGAQVLLYGVAVNPQGLDEEGHMTTFSLLAGEAIAHLTRVGCFPEGSECVYTAPDLAWLFADAPGTVNVRAQLDGQIATGTITVRVARFSSMTAGGNHSCGMATGDALFCWGAGYLETPVLVERPGLTEIEAGSDRSCGLNSLRNLYCWSPSVDAAPEPVSTSVRFSQVALGPTSSCGLDLVGKAWCWGANDWGQLGNGTKNPSSVPVAVAGGLTLSQIATYGDHACALTAGGQAYCWGANVTGELGDSTIVTGCGSFGCSTTPVPAAPDHRFTQIVAGLSFTCGLADDAQVWCWGNAGKIGAPNLGAPGAAVPVGGQFFASVTAGTDHACALTPQGKAFCWGANDRGQTGQSPGSATLRPVEVRQGKTYTALDAGSSHTCGLTADGLYCWGDNGSGQLGLRFPEPAGPSLVTGQGQ